MLMVEKIADQPAFVEGVKLPWLCARSARLFLHAAAETFRADAGALVPAAQFDLEKVTGIPLTLLTTNFNRNIYLMDRRNSEMMLLSAGYKTTAADHPHPTFSADSTRILIQSALIAPDDRNLDLVVIPVPPAWLKRK